MNSLPEAVLALLRPIALALLHFVWEGAAIAACLALALRAMQTASSNARYGACCAALLCMAACPVFNLTLLNSSSPGAAPETGVVAAVPAALVLSAVPAPQSAATTVSRLAAGADALLPWLAAAWLLGVCLCSVRLLAGWAGVKQLSRRGTSAPGPELERLFSRLAARFQVSGRVKLLHSAAVAGPGVFGWRPALILLPLSAVTQLSTAELEAILAHELAHVRRHDYLVNLLQSWVEALLFYHPGVWWVSRRIRVEREQCCDEMVVSTLCDRVTYARALASLAVVKPTLAVPVLYATDGPLMVRVRRVLGLPIQQPEAPVGGPAAIIGAAALVATVVTSQLQAAAARSHRTPSHRVAAAAHRAPSGHLAAAAHRAGGRAPSTLQATAAATVRPVLFAGQVVDDHGRPVALALVALHAGLEIQAVASTQSLQNGSFILKAPAPGHYRLSVSGPGVKASQRGVELGTVTPAAIKFTVEREALPAATNDRSETVTEVTTPLEGAAASLRSGGPVLVVPQTGDALPLATPRRRSALRGSDPRTAAPAPAVRTAVFVPSASPWPASTSAVRASGPHLERFHAVDRTSPTPAAETTAAPPASAALVVEDPGAVSASADARAAGMEATAGESSFGIAFRDGHYSLNTPAAGGW